MTKHRQYHIAGLPAVLLAPLVIPVILIIKLAERVFGLKTSADLTASDVVSYLENFLTDAGGEWDWDDFTSIPITDPALDEIREEASAFCLPLADSGREPLEELLTRARAIQDIEAVDHESRQPLNLSGVSQT